MDQTPADSVIRFTVWVAQVKTMADGGLRFAFDAPETAIDVAAALMKVKQAGGVLEIAAVPVLQCLTNVKKKTDKRATTSPIDVAGG